MKQLSTIIFLIFTNSLFAQDTLKNKFPLTFISQIELRYELIDLGKIKTDYPYLGNISYSNSHQTIKPFSPNEMPPFFDLELSEKNIFEYQDGFKIEKSKHLYQVDKKIDSLFSNIHYSTSSLIFTSNFDSKTTANFYKKSEKMNTLLTGVIFQKEEFLRSVFAWDWNREKRSIHFNFSYVNQQYYRDLDNASIFFGDRHHVFFPKKYHETRNNKLVHSTEFQNQNISGSALFAKIFLSPFKKTYLKVDYDMHWFFLNNESGARQRFRTLGIGTKAVEGTIIFLEYTNRSVGIGQFSTLININEKPYFSIYANQILKLRLFKR